MSNPVAIHARQTSGEVRPHEYAARLFGAQRVDARSTSRQTAGPACRGPRKPPESSGFDSNRRIIWGIPDHMGNPSSEQLEELDFRGAERTLSDLLDGLSAREGICR
jgi:hypothetical protein